MDSGAPLELEPEPLLLVEPIVSLEPLVSSVVDVLLVVLSVVELIDPDADIVDIVIAEDAVPEVSVLESVSEVPPPGASSSAGHAGRMDSEKAKVDRRRSIARG